MDRTNLKLWGEPALSLGILGSLLVAVGEYLSSTDELSWEALIPIVVGVVVRAFVTPAPKSGTTH